MKYAYYPGCCYDTSAREYDLSSRAVCEKLGIKLQEIDDWNCCGSTAAHSTSHLLALSLSARNLARAETQALDVVAPCAACYQRLAVARHELAGDPALLAKVNSVTGLPYTAKHRVLSMPEAVWAIGAENLRAQVTKPLVGLKVAAYYGCLLVRPRSVQIDDEENPTIIEQIMDCCGAEPTDWHYKTECCGASLGISNEDIVLQLVDGILSDAAASGADCIVCACPLCHFNLDLRQAKLNKKKKTKYKMPVFYFTQLIGLATGIDLPKLSMHTHFVDTGEIRSKYA